MPEFHPSAERRPDEVTRREFLRLVAATAALAGATGCNLRPPDDPILPYVRNAPTEPGIALHYATAMTLDGDGIGLIVESHEGRPTKIEGNPAHPSSLGASGVFEQAALLQLYDPDRASTVRQNGVAASWQAFAAAYAPDVLTRTAGQNGAGLALLLEPIASPLITDQLARVRARYPSAQVFYYSPVSRHAMYEGSRRAFGRALHPHLRLDQADVIVSLDADLLASGPCAIRHARHWADGRRLRAGSTSMSRMYVAESMLTPTGSAADAHVAVRPSEVVHIADALVSALDGRSAQGQLAADRVAWIQAAARDLMRARGRGVVIAGDRQPAIVHALAFAANTTIGSVGQAMTLGQPNWLDAGEPTHTLEPLLEALRSGSVRVLMILGPNPVYAAPDAMDVGGALARAQQIVCLGSHENETSRRASWMLPEAHFLEAWGDARACDGTVSIVQPLIKPLHGGRTVAEVLAMLDGNSAPQAYRLTRDFWTTGRPNADLWWADALRTGIVPDTTLPIIDAPGRPDAAAMHQEVMTLPRPRNGLEVVTPVATVYDGRFGNNPWLQELPHPISKLTWGNAAYVNERTAKRLQVATGQVVELSADGHTVHAPAFVLPGTADDTISLALGYGRSGREHVAEGVGTRAAALLRPASTYAIDGVSLRPVMTLGQDGQTPLVQPMPISQEHGDMEGRPIALSATLARYRQDADIAHQRRELPTLYNTFPLDKGRQWGMAIDLTVCTGCSACVVACQAENNVPVVGAPGVLEHRAMHWLRIDRYFTEKSRAPAGVVMQPMLCQHCEKAPCEYVCPVNATVHSEDGLNEMVYNRCVGTRFCSNNCPYKVRRFNWFDYNADLPEVRRMAMNPDVTVRERGVMEKCSFCVQRIREAEISARVAGRDMGPRDVVTACQQACPTRAIVFGPVNDPGADVTQLHNERRAYAVLHDLGTRPRVRYLPKITNPPEERA